MPVEADTGYLGDIDPNSPIGAVDTVDSLDNYMRARWKMLQNTFPNISGAVTPTHIELNHVDGVTSAIQPQLDSKLASSSYTAADILTKIKTVDGSGSGLDADTVDGVEGSALATLDSPAFTTTATLDGAVLAVRPTLMTAQSADAATEDFTSIPSWVKRITVHISNVSTDGTSVPIIQLGTGGTPKASGYSAMCGGVRSSDNTTVLSATDGFPIVTQTTATATIYGGSVVFTRVNSATDGWIANGNVYWNDGVDRMGLIAGYVQLSGTLDMVRLTMQNGADVFDAGTLSVMYE